jgi:hypothetical protein
MITFLFFSIRDKIDEFWAAEISHSKKNKKCQ